MSLIAAFLGWTKLPQWALELIVIGAIAGGLWFWHHEAIETGIADQVQADKVAAAKLKATTDAETATLQAKATMAQQAYDNEQTETAAYRNAHPLEPVRLCTNAGGTRLPPGGAPKSGNESPGPSAASLQPVPSGDPSGGSANADTNIGPLLDAFGAAADKVSGQLREYQQR